MQIKFVIDGNPFGKQRPFVAHNHGIKRPQTRIYERKARGTWQRVTSAPEANGEVEVHLMAFYEIPKSWPQWKHKAAVYHLIRPIKKSALKPDVDNVAKMIMDSCNPETYRHKKVARGIYADDGQVVDLSVESWYSEKPRVEVYLSVKDEYDVQEIKNKVKELEKG